MQSEKNIIIQSLLDRVNASPFLFVVDYHGLDVPSFGQLRDQLRDAGAEIHVYKNTFVKSVIRTKEYPADLEQSLSGQTAVVTGEQDVCGVAKTVKTFGDKHARKKPEIKGGVLDGRFLSAEDIRGLAELPSLEVLQAQLLGLMNQPGTMLVRLLNEPASALARVLQAKVDQEQGSTAA